MLLIGTLLSLNDVAFGGQTVQWVEEFEHS